MLKKLFKLINKKKQVQDINYTEICTKEKDIEEDIKIDEISLTEINDNEDNKYEDIESEILKEDLEERYEFLKENEEYIKDIKIKRAKSIRAIDLYTEEVFEFKTYKECSKNLRVPITYIKENLKYGNTDYLGDAINYIKKSLGESVKNEDDYLNNSKTPIELLNLLNNKIFSGKISQNKIDEILSNEKIEPIKMHYKFEYLDIEYDDYFKKYGAIIKRGGVKKIELINTKGEVIEVFKSLNSCSEYLNKDKNEIKDMLKYGYTKIGRHEIRYSLRNI